MRMTMRIDVRDRGFKATEAVRNYVGLRLMSVLDHQVRQVDGVTVYLADVHAPEGGVDKRCRMLALLTSSGEVRVQETDPGLYAAIDHAAERLAHGVALELARPAMSAAARLGQVRPGAVEVARSRGLKGISRAAQQMEST
jgi:ribosome-associated translation inhibitor RaiA